MTLFLLAAIITAAVVACLLRPLLSRGAAPAPRRRDHANIEIFTHQAAQLQQERENDALTEEQFQQYRLELETRAMEDAGAAAEDVPLGQGNSPFLAMAIALFIPLLALAVYSVVGDSRFMTAPSPGAVDDAGLKQALSAVEKHVAENPGDVEAKITLARIYAGMGRDADAAALYEELLRARADEPGVLVGFAEALARTRDNRFTGKPAELLRRALELAPHHERALWLAGFAALQAGDRAQALSHWRRLLAVMDSDTEIYRQVKKMLAETEAERSPPPPAPPGEP